MIIGLYNKTLVLKLALSLSSVFLSFLHPATFFSTTHLLTRIPTVF